MYLKCECRAGLPDFSWYLVQKREKCNNFTLNVPNGHKISQMSNNIPNGHKISRHFPI
jgi:lysozyme family protein